MMQERILGDINPDQENALATVSPHFYDFLNMIEDDRDPHGATKIDAGAIVAERHPVNLLAFLEGKKFECPVSADKEVSVEWRC